MHFQGFVEKGLSRRIGFETSVAFSGEGRHMYLPSLPLSEGCSETVQKTMAPVPILFLPLLSPRSNDGSPLPADGNVEQAK